MKKSIKYIIAFLSILSAGRVYGQNAEMADAFRSEGKIYVVVAIILIVLAGLIIYLFVLDRKLNKLEQMIKGKKQTKREGKAL